MGVRLSAVVALLITFAGLLLFGVTLPEFLAYGFRFWTMVRLIVGGLVGIVGAVAAIYTIEAYYYLGGAS